MTDEQKKEALSRAFVSTFAHLHGVKCLGREYDHGVDLTLCPVEMQNRNGTIRYLDSPHKIDIQIKSTTTANVHIDDDSVKYDLEAKTFNDLVCRRMEMLPLYLVLVVFESDPPDCVEVDHERLSMLGCAYWYLPDENEGETANVARKRISIPFHNRVDSEFVRTIYRLSDIEI